MTFGTIRIYFVLDFKASCTYTSFLGITTSNARLPQMTLSSFQRRPCLLVLFSIEISSSYFLK